MKKALLLATFIFSHHLVEAKDRFYIKVLNGVYQGPSAGVDYYTLSSGDSLELTAIFEGISPPTVSTGLSVDWYVDYMYQFTQGGSVSFYQPSVLIYFETYYIFSSVISENKIMFTYVTGINDLTHAPLPYPFSQSSININNLRYTIVNATGEIFEKGKFSGEIILRKQMPQRPLPAGIYFVIYYDALDNRQVLTDKVFIR